MEYCTFIKYNNVNILLYKPFMSQIPQEVLVAAIVGTGVFFLIVVSFILFMLIYQRRQFAHQQEKNRIRDEYEREILRTQLEVQEQTLQQIGREIHDNVGQTLAVTRLYLSGLEDQEWEGKERLAESNKLVSDAMRELRSIAHGLNSDRIQQIGIAEALRIEAERISNSGRMKTSFSCEGEIPDLKPEHELVSFRICQEALANCLRHSEATEMRIQLVSSPEQFQIGISDNGNGKAIQEGNGITNMKRRAVLIGAEFEISAHEGKGCTVRLSLPLKK